MRAERLADCRARLVRHGPERVTNPSASSGGIGPVPVEPAKLRVRVGEDESSATVELVRFTPAILLKWARRTTSPDALLPVLHLRGISTGDVAEVLAALLGQIGLVFKTPKCVPVLRKN